MRDFTPIDSHSTDVPVLVDAPYAGHNSSIADYAKGQSLVETLQTGGLAQVRIKDAAYSPAIVQLKADGWMGTTGHTTLKKSGGATITSTLAWLRSGGRTIEDSSPLQMIRDGSHAK